ncbi:VanZ family protein [Flavobacterium sp. SUN052]|uniref:VanZ family protein n=1 Tax=Flavobacterium sp. SUN052 TaxID=3002441 RepID=UPI00237DBDD8|nr:VanZ family protein [Flavobacterium sp. SUN052]MEC4003202.1 VanZ family protein [Flavobacterium sp. SUN052]
MIIILSLISLGDVGESIDVPNKDKIVHFTFYFVFVMLWSLFFKTKNNSIIILFIILFLAIVFGILIEICQGFTKDRTPDPIDALANSIGAIFGLIFTLLFLKNTKSHS